MGPKGLGSVPVGNEQPGGLVNALIAIMGHRRCWLLEAAGPGCPGQAGLEEEVHLPASGPRCLPSRPAGPHHFRLM